MYRVSKGSGNKFYAVSIDLEDSDCILDIEALVDQGSPVVIVEDLFDLHQLFDIEELDVEVL